MRNVSDLAELRCFPQAGVEHEEPVSQVSHDDDDDDEEQPQYDLMRGKPKDAAYYEGLAKQFPCFEISPSEVFAQASKRESRKEAQAREGATAAASAAQVDAQADGAKKKDPARKQVPLCAPCGGPWLMRKMICRCNTCQDAGFECAAAMGEWMEPSDFFTGAHGQAPCRIVSFSWLVLLPVQKLKSHVNGKQHQEAEKILKARAQEAEEAKIAQSLATSTAAAEAQEREKAAAETEQSQLKEVVAQVWDRSLRENG